MNQSSPFLIAFWATVGLPLFLGEADIGENFHEDASPFENFGDPLDATKPKIFEA